MDSFNKYQRIAKLYDLLDYPWEKRYQSWRKTWLSDLSGQVLEAGVGTGHNFAYYPHACQVTGIEISPAMLLRAQARKNKAVCQLDLQEGDITDLSRFADESFDWVVSTFVLCTLPAEKRIKALKEFARVLKPNGKIRLFEIVLSRSFLRRSSQRLSAWLTHWLYHVDLSQSTQNILVKLPELEIKKACFLSGDVYQLLELETSC